jgi:hypothetical protein
MLIKHVHIKLKKLPSKAKKEKKLKRKKLKRKKSHRYKIKIMFSKHKKQLSTKFKFP